LRVVAKPPQVLLMTTTVSVRSLLPSRSIPK
jgi:hypothetical protein